MQKSTTLLLMLGFVLVYSAAPRFLNPVYIQSNGKNIDVEYYGSPFVYDWDGDGKKDLLVGQFYYGKIRYYRNIGTNNNPVFGDSVFLTAGGVEIQLPYG
ncbi:MAG: hypothetical protein ABIL05_04665 [candidate division WOR-3 bacterium]